MSNGYAHVERLDQGRWTSLYRAVRQRDGCRVLLEVLNSERSDAERVQLLASQLEIGRALDSPFVLRPLAASELDGRPALELTDSGGVPLGEAFAASPTIGELVQLAVHVTKAVADIHARGVVHGALAPRYVIVDAETATVRLFGLWHAQPVTLDGVVQRPVMRIEDSLPYVSPEQTGRLNRHVDRRSDLYSLGVVFFELFTGRLPFEAKDAVGWVHSHLARKPPIPSELSPSVPPVLSSIVLKLLEKSPDERYQSAAGLLHDLEQCLAALRARGSIAPFAIGRTDVNSAFTIPHKLYGRERERARLLECFERALSSGSPRLVLVSGAAGAGKSSLVHELSAPAAARGARFVAGKFDSFERELPYSAIVAVLRELSLDVLAESAETISEYRSRINAAVGQSATLVCGLLPELGLILGRQPPAGALPPAEVEKRMRGALRRLVFAFATSERPVLMFLDDVQWIDRASVELLAELVGDPSRQALLIVAAYREGELGSGHPLRQALERLSGGGEVLDELQLGPLSVSDLGQLVADLVHVERSDALPLARALHDKTAGNPLFVVQLLSDLHRRKLIFFESAVGQWRWHLRAIVAEPCSDNVTELLLVRLRGLPAELQQTLGMAAHLGRSFELATLALVMARVSDSALRAAVAEGLLVLVGGRYQFPHDRVRDAAYSLIPEGERAAQHLAIGRQLLAATPPEQLDERIFEVVRHLDLGAALLTSGAERERLAELNLRAGQRAQASAAPSAARDYFAAGEALLDRDAFTQRYELSFALRMGRVESELALGNSAAAEESLAELAGHARGFVDRAAAARAQATAFVMRGEFAKGLEVVLELLRSAGIDWPPEPSAESIRDEYESLRAALAERPIESLLESGLADATTQATMEALLLMMEVASSFSEGLLRVGACRMARLSLERGYCDASPLALVYLGQIVGPYFGDYPSGFRLARFGLELQAARQQARFSGRMLAMAGAFVYPWTQPLGQAIELLHRGFDACLESGELMFAWLTLRAEVSLRIFMGAPLPDVAGVASRARELVRTGKLGGFFSDMVTIDEQLIRALRGMTSTFPAFDDTGFEEGQFEAHLRSDENLVIVEGWYWIRKLQARCLGGDHDTACAAGKLAEALLWTTGFAIERMEYHLYRALDLAAQFDAATPEEREQRRSALVECVAELRDRARDCPSNFAAYAALAGAELARIDGDDRRAAVGYEDAIRLAREELQLSALALGFETASSYYRARGFDLIAGAYLREARSAYRRWGAEGKVKQLEQQRPSLALEPTTAETSMLDLRDGQLDLLAVIKASQTLSSVMLEDQVLKVLLQIVLEQGGARRARLFLSEESNGEAELRVAAEASIEDASPLLQPAPRVPSSIVEYVRRTGTFVLLEDATLDAGRFAADPYLARARPRSVLCLPVRRHGVLAGVLYLDNELAPGVFTPDRLLALELLATQAAVSLQNASLLARERAAREEAQRDRRRALLLGEVTALLADTGDRAALSRAVRLVCEYGLSDWVLLNVIQAGSTTCVAHAHRDTAKEPLVAELSKRYAAGFCAAALGQRELGAEVHQASLSDEQIRWHCVDDEHAALARKLGMRSLLAVPILARGTTLGVLFLVAAGPHHFQAADVTLAVELGRRLGAAIEGARLAELERLLQQSQKMEAIGRLAGGVAHDFNNVLCVILGYSLLVLDKLAPGHPALEEIAEITKGAERAAELTRQLLTFSRHRPVEAGVIDVNQVVSELKQMLMTLIGSQVRVMFEPGEDLWKTRADRGQLEQLLLNLAANARDAMPGGGTLLIETTNVRLDEASARKRLDASPGQYVSLAVTDTGCGIEPEVRERIFEPFFTTKQPGKGTGLGLATAFGFVRQAGGHIAVESEVGRGTTFRILLPRAIAASDTVSMAPAAPVAPTLRGSETVLLVEDDDQLRGTVRAALQRHGYKVLDAGSPGDALLVSERYSEAIHLLLSDIVLPHMSGPELAERILATRPGLRLLFMSGYNETPVSRLSVDILQKPFTPQRLADAVRRVFELGSKNGTHH